MSEAVRKTGRPLSPHLQVYRMIPTMAMSILHRITGAALYFGTALVAWWLAAVATGEAYFGFVDAIFGSWIGRIVLFGYTWALIHHLLGGIKHLVQDTGRALEKHFTTRMARLQIAASVALTIVVWAIAYAVR